MKDANISGKGRLIKDYTDFRGLDKKNERYWKNRYMSRTGKNNARGWNNSEEYEKYISSKDDRRRRLLEQNPEEYSRKLQKIDRKKKDKSGRRFMYYYREFEGIEGWNELLLILSDLSNAKVNAEKFGKKLVVAAVLDGQRAVGYNNSVSLIRDKVQEWRDWAKEMKAMELSYGLISFSGYLESTEGKEEIVVLIKADAKLIDG